MSRIRDLLNLSYVRRWNLLCMSQPQTVAEHSFRVAVIAVELADLYGCYHMAPTSVLWAILHDGDESCTGDIPAPFKRKIKGTLLNSIIDSMCPWRSKAKQDAGEDVTNLVRVADLIEAYTWWEMHGDPRQNHRYISNMGRPIIANLDSLVAESQALLGPGADGVVRRICQAILRPDPKCTEHQEAVDACTHSSSLKLTL